MGDGTSDSDRSIQITRAWTGLLAVVVGDLVVAAVVIAATLSANVAAETLVAILASAFTAVATLTTAYFGIRAIANTAQRAVEQAGQPGTQAVQPIPVSPAAGPIPPQPPADLVPGP